MEPQAQQQWINAVAVLAGALALGYMFRRVVMNRLGALFARTATDVDDAFVQAVRPHVPIWFVLGGTALAARLAPVGEKAVETVDRLCAVGLVVSLTFAAARIGTAMLGRYTRRAGAEVATTSLAQNVLRIVIFASGSLLVLTNLGVEITPLLATLGVGSLAVALALQPTLSNLFAGLHLTFARPIRVGDYVELETGVKGFVEDIGWRAIRVRELPNNIVIVPNARVADMIVKNYNLPEPEQAALVQVGVSYDSDLAHVERVTIEVAREVLREVPGGVPSFEPFIRYHTFGDSSINFTVILRVAQFTDRFLVTHEFVKRLKARYDREGIVIPFPQRVLHGAVAALPASPVGAAARGMRDGGDPSGS